MQAVNWERKFLKFFSLRRGGEHEIGAMGRHVTRGLLVASRADGWAFVENLLLAAQRQEGLRQTILETIDEAHPEAFRRMLRLIVDHDLTRFSAVVRAVDVWFGFGWESVNNRVVKEVLGEVLQFLEYPEVREEVLGSYEPPRRQERRENENAQRVYLALWTLAFEDAVAAIAVISRFLEHPDVEYRFVAVRLLAQLGLVEAQVALLPALEDEDLRVVTCALMVVQGGADKTLQETDLFERLERILPRFPKQVTTLQPLVWDWIRLEAQQQTVANALVGNLGDRSPKRLIPYLSFLDASNRSYVATKLAEVKPWDDEIRNILFSLVGDASNWVRERVLQALATCTITAYEATQFERLLSRKSGDLRRGILQLLLNQLDEEAIASAQRLLAAGDANQRVAGLELLRQMMIKERAVSRCQVCVQEYQLQPKKRTSAETELLEVVLNTNSAVPTLEDALGLIDPLQLTPRIPPQVQKPRLFVTPAAIACLKSLDDP
jgi:HEAT repeat protein